MRKLRAPALALLLALAPFLVAAAAQEGKAPPPKAPAPARRSAPIRYRYEIDAPRSRVSFTFRGLVLPFDGHFALLEGEIFLGVGDPFRNASARVRIQAASVRTEDELQQKMLRDQVLEAGRYPHIDLRVEAARASKAPDRRGRERDWEVRARGRLRLHGVEKEVALTFRLADTGTDLYVRGEGTLRLSGFGMDRPKVLLLLPGQDAIEVRVRLVAHPAPRRDGS